MKIEFIPVSKFAEKFLTPPLPAKKVLPEWYKKMNLLQEGEHNYKICNNGVPNTTLKACNPFLDSLISGYVICLSSDFQITQKKSAVCYDEDKNKKIIEFNWRTPNSVITDHSKEQHPLLPSPFNGDNSVFKFNNEFIIKTPRGYSTYFFHPANQHDLPFRLFSGVVDTDSYMSPVHFPFQLLEIKDGTMIIEKGTPICQFVPFKRDGWIHTVKRYNDDLVKRENFKYFSRIYRAYKSLHWVKKKFN